MMTSDATSDCEYMRRALELAARGEGWVEPNPMVGCLIVQQGTVVGHGYHERFGQTHAEVNALRVAGSQARGATAYVTLEPCCHQGKTAPCVTALIQAGIARVVVATLDPFPHVDGKGAGQLRQAGIQVDVGILESESQQLLAPYRKRLLQQRPWIIAKWAMTLDGKLASYRNHSQWISCQASREIVHRLRGRVDGVMVGARTAAIDNPRLTARPAGPRTAARIVIDSSASLAQSSQLVTSASQPDAAAVLVAVADASSIADDRQRQVINDRVMSLQQAGCEVVTCHGETPHQRLDDLLCQLADRQMTNILVEGGGQLLGSLFDLNQIDEVHVFIAPKLLGGSAAVVPIAGRGRETVDLAPRLNAPVIQPLGDDVYVRGRIAPTQPKSTDVDNNRPGDRD